MRPILVIMWTAFQSFILQDNNNNNNNNNNNLLKIIIFLFIAELTIKSYLQLTSL